eukprot:g17795.t1
MHERPVKTNLCKVTELIIAQLLYLNYESADKPITLYINSTGSTIKNNTGYIGESKVGMETDAFAIADCMGYIKPDIQTIAIGQASRLLIIQCF